MHPTLIRIGSFTIHTYGVFVAVGFLVGIALAMREARRIGEDATGILDLSFYILIWAIVGSRLLYVVMNYQAYAGNPLEILKLWKGGLTFQGGLLASCLTLFWYAKKYCIKLGRLADILAPSVAIGQAFGRIGCFFAGCCYGKETHLYWAITFRDPESLAPVGIPLHPTQIYHALSLFLIFLILMGIRRFKTFEGEIAWSYLLLHSVQRSFIENFRGDVERSLFGGITTPTQVISIIIGLTSLYMLWHFHKH
jgi:phosphatidylglycerol:prolipoprotein diacylglycerol transferase